MEHEDDCQCCACVWDRWAVDEKPFYNWGSVAERVARVNLERHALTCPDCRTTLSEQQIDEIIGECDDP